MAANSQTKRSCPPAETVVIRRNEKLQPGNAENMILSIVSILSDDVNCFSYAALLSRVAEMINEVQVSAFDSTPTSLRLNKRDPRLNRVCVHSRKR